MSMVGKYMWLCVCLLYRHRYQFHCHLCCRYIQRIGINNITTLRQLLSVFIPWLTLSPTLCRLPLNSFPAPTLFNCNKFQKWIRICVCIVTCIVDVYSQYAVNSFAWINIYSTPNTHSTTRYVGWCIAHFANEWTSERMLKIFIFNSAIYLMYYTASFMPEHTRVFESDFMFLKF